MSHRPTPRVFNVRLLGPAVLACWIGTVAATDISPVPLATQTNGAARANIMFILDDSTSMEDEYLPDGIVQTNKCFGYHGYNRIYFDPSKTYDPPPDATGVPLPNAQWSAAYRDGYTKAGTPLNLAKYLPFKRYVGGVSHSYDYYYTVRKITGLVTTCDDSEYTAVKTIADAQKQNYANWFSYYRTRQLAMRAGVGRAFSAVDASKVRVGFSTIHGSSVAESSRFLNIRDFDAGTQRADFYKMLYGSGTLSGTPLRSALERTGKYFAKKAHEQTIDPVQYSCQRNYAILSSDGYWNESGQPSGWKASRVDGKLLTDEDGKAAAPYRDASAVGPTLADVAYHYYVTDLRTGPLANCHTATSSNVCNNNVAPFGRDDAKHQHMTTYTIGLGLSGTLAYTKEYESTTTGDYAAIKKGDKQWPNPMKDSPARVDDLWHAAVNGRGRFFSANDTTELASALSATLNAIGQADSAGSGAGMSTLLPVPGDDKVFIGKYTPGAWTGELEAYSVDVKHGGVLNPTAPHWEAGALLQARNLSTSPRRILAFKSSAPGQLGNFAYAELSATQRAYFDNLCTLGKLAQCASLSAGALAKVTGSNVVDFLAGRRELEMSAASADNRVFRARATPLGDIVNASPLYVKKAPFKYVDGGHAAFLAQQATRKGVVYAGANDGMLHAFDAATGHELWAYVPSMVMPELHRLADRDYGLSNKHRYFVDATPVSADVLGSSGWRTILVGGLGAGGRGYYALDITDPDNPKGLWEFTDAHLGLTYGNPVITKLKDGTWVVLVTSGVDNNAGGGDGNGRLYVLDALTGALIGPPIQTYVNATAAGTVSAPNNLGRLNAWVETETDNTALRAYAGDMRGNVWRFDFDNNVAPAGNEAFLLGTARAPNGTPQPITVKPQLTEITWGTSNKKAALVSVGTGRYLGQADLNDTTVQSLYVIKDELSAAPLGDLRANSALVEQTVSTTSLTPPILIDWSVHAGWYVDFDKTAKERVNIEMQQQFNLLVIATNVPTATACSPGGTGSLYYFDLRNGGGALAMGSETPIVGIMMVLVDTANGAAGKPVIEVTQGSGSITTIDPRFATPGVSASVRRTSWRELIH